MMGIIAPRILSPYKISLSLSTCRTTTLKISQADSTTFATAESYVHGTAMTTSQLDIPFAKVVGCPPTPPLQRDLVITEQKLECFAEEIWKKQGFM